MARSITQPCVSRSYLAALSVALLPLTQRAFAADDTREREHLAAIVRQIDTLDRLVRQSSVAAAQRSRYYFEYRRLDADIKRIRVSVTDYLNPPRSSRHNRPA